MKKEVMIWTGAGQIGMAIARRVGFGKKIVVCEVSGRQARYGRRGGKCSGAFDESSGGVYYGQ